MAARPTAALFAVAIKNDEADSFNNCLPRFLVFISLAEKKCDTPKSGQTYKAVDQSADQSGLAAEDPRHKVKFGKTDQTPVDRANDREDQCDCIHSSINSISFGFYQFAQLFTTYA